MLLFLLIQAYFLCKPHYFGLQRVQPGSCCRIAMRTLWIHSCSCWTCTSCVAFTLMCQLSSLQQLLLLS